MVADLQRLALRRRVAILAVHHTTKARYENVIDEVSGTTGLTAAADTIIVLTQAQGSAVLHVRGRDVAREELAVRFDPALGTWTLVGEAKEPVISPERQAVLAVLRQAARPMRPREIRCALGRQDKKSMGALYVLLHAMREAGDIDSPGRGLYTTKITKNTKNAQVTKNAKDPLPVEEVLQAVECILSNCHETAQDAAKDASIKHDSENGHENAILSDLSDLSATSSFTAMVACPECGGREWHSSSDGTLTCMVCLYQATREEHRLDEMAELEAARQEREAETEVRRAMGWYATECAHCQWPLWDRTVDEILAGAELCLECDLPPQDLQWLRE